jgi:hypothetical protein
MMPEGVCVRADEVDQFLSGEMKGGERAKIESHLSRCRHCRHRLVARYQELKAEASLLQAPRRLKSRAFEIPQRRRAASPVLVSGLRRSLAVAAAALVVAVAAGLAYFIYTNDAARQQVPPEVLRQEERNIQAPRLLAPSADAVIASDEIEFRWSRVESAQGYKLTLLDEKGDILFIASTEQERIVLKAADAHLERGVSYFWYVAAKSPFGTTIDSEIAKFKLAE